MAVTFWRLRTCCEKKAVGHQAVPRTPRSPSKPTTLARIPRRICERQDDQIPQKRRAIRSQKTQNFKIYKYWTLGHMSVVPCGRALNFKPKIFVFSLCPLLGGSWVVLSRVRSVLSVVTSKATILIALLIPTHEPPSGSSL